MTMGAVRTSVHGSVISKFRARKADFLLCFYFTRLIDLHNRPHMKPFLRVMGFNILKTDFQLIFANSSFFQSLSLNLLHGVLGICPPKDTFVCRFIEEYFSLNLFSIFKAILDYFFAPSVVLFSNLTAPF